jgi:hypothetical protein
MEWLSRRKIKLMTVRHPRYSKEEFAQRGDEIYESQIRSQVEAGNQGKIVAINFDWLPVKPFTHDWQDYRTHKDRSLKTISDTSMTIEVEV